jgi:hypothetical protein
MRCRTRSRSQVSVLGRVREATTGSVLGTRKMDASSVLDGTVDGTQIKGGKWASEKRRGPQKKCCDGPSKQETLETPKEGPFLDPYSVLSLRRLLALKA